MTEQSDEEEKAIEISVKLPKRLIGSGSKIIHAIKELFLVFLIALIGLGSKIVHAIKESFLVFLIVLLIILVPSILGALWWSPEYMQLPIFFTCIGVAIAFAVVGMLVYLAPVRQQRDNLSAQRDNLLADKKKLDKDFEDVKKECENYRESYECCQKLLVDFIVTKTRATKS